VILDVRTPKEFGEGHVENAVSLNFFHEDFRKGLAKLDRDKTYLVYCRSGNRSSKAVEIMKGLNFKSVYHLPAGIVGWEEEGLPQKK
jgi:rhodanese-related sulfurtransferase